MGKEVFAANVRGGVKTPPYKPRVGHTPAGRHICLPYK